MEEIEVWKAVKEFEGYYEVSNLGRVRSIARITISYNDYKKEAKLTEVKEKIIASKPPKNGHYRGVKLLGGGRYCSIMVARLVGLHFLPLVEGDTCINHKDGNRINDKASNLEWVTRSGNSKHGWKLRKDGRLREENKSE